jgi:hypothetical protein
VRRARLDDAAHFERVRLVADAVHIVFAHEACKERDEGSVRARAHSTRGGGVGGKWESEVSVVGVVGCGGRREYGVLPLLLPPDPLPLSPAPLSLCHSLSPAPRSLAHRCRGVLAGRPPARAGRARLPRRALLGAAPPGGRGVRLRGADEGALPLLIPI